MLARFSKLKERSSSTPTQGAPNPARSPHPTFRDGQALGSTPGTVLPSERPKDYPMPNANDAHPSPAPDNHHKRSRNDDLRTRGSADNPTSTQTYTIEPTSIQGEPSPKIIQHAGEIAQLDGPDTSSLQQIPDEDEFQALEGNRGANLHASDTISPIQVDQKLHNLHVSDHSVGHMEVDLAAHLPDTDHGTDNHVDDVEKNVPGCGNEDFTGDRGADLNASDTTSPISFQVDEKPHELLVSDPTAGHLDVAAHLPETDHITGSTGMHVGDVANNVLGCGNGDVADKDRKIAAVVDTPSDVVANGPTPHSHEVRGGIESSRISEEGLGSNPNQQDKSNISPLETGDVGDAPGSRNPLEVPSLIDSDGESMLPGEKPGATGNDGNKKGIVRFGMLRNKPKKVSTYMKKAGKIFKVKTEDLKEDDVIIAIMGPTGAGKSSFINMATGNATGVGHDLESCTNSIDILKFQCIERSMQDIIFVDTPAFDDTHKSEVEILEMIASWLKQTYEKNVKLAGILYFHRITDNKMAGTMKSLHMFKKLCGKDALQNVILTTTMWDEVAEATGEQREKELERHHWKTMIDQGSRTMRYHNTEKSAWEIIDDIVIRNDERYAVELQRELVDLRELSETGVGRELLARVQGLVKQQQATLHRLRKSIKRHGDGAILNVLRDVCTELRRQTEAKVKETEVLKIPIGERLRRLSEVKLTQPSILSEAPAGHHSDKEICPNLSQPSTVTKSFKVRIEELEVDDIVIVIMGPTGAGKSSFVNLATGNATRVGHGLEACTESIDMFKLQRKDMQNIIFVDTPGFRDDAKFDTGIGENVVSCLKQIYEQNVRLAGILYLHRITDNRVVSTFLKDATSFRSLYSEDELQKIVLVTTMWDEVDQAAGAETETELERYYQKTMLKQGSRIMRHINTFQSAWDIVDHIVDGHNKRNNAELQKEMVNLETRLLKTSAGKELFGKLRALVKRQQDILCLLRDSMKRDDDQYLREVLKDEYEQLRRWTEAQVKQMEALDMPIGKRLHRFSTSTLGFSKE